MEITTLQRRFLRSIVRKVVRQGNHKKKITEFYRVLVDAARKEFTEDNKPTLDGFLNDCHAEALNKQRELEQGG